MRTEIRNPRDAVRADCESAWNWTRFYSLEQVLIGAPAKEYRL